MRRRRRSPKKHMRRAHLRDTESRKINIKKTVVGKGWHGDRLGHSLASRGLKPAEHKHLYQGTLSDKVFDFLQTRKIPLTANEVSNDTGLARQTVVKCLKELYENKKIEQIKMGDRIYWKTINNLD